MDVERYALDHSKTLDQVADSFGDAVRSKDLDLFNFLLLSIAVLAEVAKRKIEFDLDVLAN